MIVPEQMPNALLPLPLPEQRAAAWRWILALESGEFAQTKKVLKNETGYCCLGVACEVLRPGRWTDHMVVDGEDTEPGFGFRSENDEQAPGTGVETTTTLPDELTELLAIGNDGSFWISYDPDANPDPGFYLWPIADGHNALTGANDGGASFDQIAQALRVAYGFPERPA